MTLLRVENVSKHFGSLIAVDDVSLIVEPGTLALIRLKSARSWNRASKTRCGDTVWLKRVFGANDGNLPPATLDATPSTSLPGRPAKPRTAFGAFDASTRAARNG